MMQAMLVVGFRTIRHTVTLTMATLGDNVMVFTVFWIRRVRFTTHRRGRWTQQLLDELVAESLWHQPAWRFLSLRRYAWSLTLGSNEQRPVTRGTKAHGDGRKESHLARMPAAADRSFTSCDAGDETSEHCVMVYQGIPEEMARWCRLLREEEEEIVLGQTCLPNFAYNLLKNAQFLVVLCHPVSYSHLW